MFQLSAAQRNAVAVSAPGSSGGACGTGNWQGGLARPALLRRVVPLLPGPHSPLPTPKLRKCLFPRSAIPLLSSLSLSLSVSLSLPRSLPFLSPSRPHPESGLLQSGEKCSRPSRNTLQQKHERLRLNDRLSLSLSALLSCRALEKKISFYGARSRSRPESC